MKKLLLGLLISALFLFLILRQISLSLVVEYMKRANIVYIALAVSIHFVGFYLRALRWGKILTDISNQKTNYLFKVTSLGYMFNNLLPLRLGDIVITFILAKEKGGSKSSLLATVVIEKI